MFYVVVHILLLLRSVVVTLVSFFLSSLHFHHIFFCLHIKCIYICIPTSLLMNSFWFGFLFVFIISLLLCIFVASHSLFHLIQSAIWWHFLQCQLSLLNRFITRLFCVQCFWLFIYFCNVCDCHLEFVFTSISQ